MSRRDPTVVADLERLVEPATRGDPESPLRWTSTSLRTLAAALRVIAAAAHVRTLTIPVLANGTKKRAPVAGMLAKWRKNRTASQEPEGCDPAVFGEQISTYLQEAAAERAQIAEDELLADEPMPAALPTAFEPAEADRPPAVSDGRQAMRT